MLLCQTLGLAIVYHKNYKSKKYLMFFFFTLNFFMLRKKRLRIHKRLAIFYLVKTIDDIHLNQDTCNYYLTAYYLWQFQSNSNMNRLLNFHSLPVFDALPVTYMEVLILIRLLTVKATLKLKARSVPQTNYTLHYNHLLAWSD